LRSNYSADNTAEDGSTRPITVVVVVVVMMVMVVILGKLHAGRRLLCTSRIISF
jgi:hypothetical protein